MEISTKTQLGMRSTGFPVTELSDNNIAKFIAFQVIANTLFLRLNKTVLLKETARGIPPAA